MEETTYESSPFDTEIDLSGVEAEPVESVKKMQGELQSVVFGQPNENNNQQITITMNYPVGEPNPTTLVGSYGYFNRTLHTGSSKNVADEGLRKAVQIQKGKLDSLKKATGVSLPSQMSGKIVMFSYRPRNDNPSQGEFSTIYPVKN